MKRVSRRIIWIGGVVAGLFAAFFGATELVQRKFMPECFDTRETVFSADDGVHDAVFANQYCAGSDAYWVTIRDHRRWFGGNTQVFLTWNFAANVAWVDPHHVVITINEVSHFGTTRHEGDGITITYRLADRLTRASYEQKMRQEELRVEELLREHQATFSGDKSNDYYPQGLAQQLSVMRENYVRFRQWAEINAENGNE